MKVYVVIEEWGTDNGNGADVVGVYSKQEDARKALEDTVARERTNRGAEIKDADDPSVETGDLVESLTADSYENYTMGEYAYDHYTIKIEKTNLQRGE